MGNKELHEAPDETPEASYKIIKYPAAEIPKQYYNMLEAKYLRELQKGNDFFKLIEPDAYYKIHKPYFQTLIERPQSKIRLAVLTDDPDVVLGWSLMEPGKLHFVWCGGDYRRKGIASALIREEFSVFTHFTRAWLAIWPVKFKKAIFNPYS